MKVYYIFGLLTIIVSPIINLTFIINTVRLCALKYCITFFQINNLSILDLEKIERHKIFYIINGDLTSVSFVRSPLHYISDTYLRSGYSYNCSNLCIWRSTEQFILFYSDAFFPFRINSGKLDSSEGILHGTFKLMLF